MSETQPGLDWRGNTESDHSVIIRHIVDIPYVRRYLASNSRLFLEMAFPSEAVTNMHMKIVSSSTSCWMEASLKAQTWRGTYYEHFTQQLHFAPEGLNDTINRGILPLSIAGSGSLLSLSLTMLQSPR